MEIINKMLQNGMTSQKIPEKKPTRRYDKHMKKIYSPSEFFSTPLHQWLCYLACQLTVSTPHIQFGFCGRVLLNLNLRILRKSRLTYSRRGAYGF